MAFAVQSNNHRPSTTTFDLVLRWVYRLLRRLRQLYCVRAIRLPLDPRGSGGRLGNITLWSWKGRQGCAVDGKDSKEVQAHQGVGESFLPKVVMVKEQRGRVMREDTRTENT